MPIPRQVVEALFSAASLSGLFPVSPLNPNSPRYMQVGVGCFRLPVPLYLVVFGGTFIPTLSLGKAGQPGKGNKEWSSGKFVCL